MPLELSDPRWNELKSSYGSVDDVVAWLMEAYDAGDISDERLGDLINEVEHQGGTSPAMYAVAPHLVALAHETSPETSLHLLTDAGMIYANAGKPGAVPCPDFLRDDFISSAAEGARILAPLLPLAVKTDAYIWAAAGLAGFLGHDAFARLLEGLDFHEGKFYHVLLEGPFPAEH